MKAVDILDGLLESAERNVDKTISTADGLFLTSIAKAIEHLNLCQILLRLAEEEEFRNQAQTWSRMMEARVGYPTKQTVMMPQHWIFYDPALPPAHGSRLVGHELYHVLQHDPTGSDRMIVDGFVQYSDEEEKEADLFSIVMLYKREFLKGRGKPKNVQEFRKILDVSGLDEFGGTDHLTAEEIERVIDKLCS